MTLIKDDTAVGYKTRSAKENYDAKSNLREFAVEELSKLLNTTTQSHIFTL